jgi:hypothetical protein
MLQLNQQKDELVKELFIDTGDEDYVIARWCLLNRLSRQFFWNAAQSIEKYLKAALLLNGYTSRCYKHHLVSLFKEVSRVVGDLIPQQLEAPKQVKLFADHRELWGDLATIEFVSRIDKHGDPSNRYNFFGVELAASDLYKLDQVVFALRNIAVKLDDTVEARYLTDPTNVGKTYLELIHEQPNRQLFPFAKFLKKSKETTRILYDAASENNFPFAPNYNHRELQLTIHNSVSRLEILFSKTMRADSTAILNWAERNIQFSDEDLEALDKHFPNRLFRRKKKGSMDQGSTKSKMTLTNRCTGRGKTVRHAGNHRVKTKNHGEKNGIYG